MTSNNKNTDTMPEPEESDLLFEIPVYLSRSEKGEVLLLNYPTQTPLSMQLDGAITEARLRPHSQQLELDQVVSSNTVVHDTSKGDQLALNADGPHRDQRDPKDNFFSNNTMDRLLLRSECPLRDVDMYAVARYEPGAGLYLVPLSSVLTMKPALDYLDHADARVKSDKKADDDAEDGMTKEEESRQVMVRFERNENDRMKSARKRSYNYHQRRIQDEPWITMSYNELGGPTSYGHHIKDRTFQNDPDDSGASFHLPPSHFMSLLCPPSSAHSVSAGASAAQVHPRDVSKAMLHTYPLEKQIEIIMRKVNVARFAEIVECLEKEPGGQTESQLIEKVQMSATLVQGCWVLKSDLLYPIEASKPSTNPSTAPMLLSSNTSNVNSRLKFGATTETPSGTAYSAMVTARERILYELVKRGHVDRGELSTELPLLPDTDLTDILSGVATSAGNRRWNFKREPDDEFIKKHNSLAQRYSMKWDYQFQPRTLHTS